MDFGMDGPPSSATIALGRAIQRQRKRQGIKNQEDFAKATGEGKSVLAKIEAGRRTPTPEVWEAITNTLTFDPEHLVTLNMLWWIARNQEDPAAAKMMPWFEVEAQAHTLRHWNLSLVPGRAQTEDYARELFLAWKNTPDEANAMARERTARQEIMDGPNGPDVTIILWERILDTLLGTPKIMHDQMARLVELSDHPRVHIHILPTSVGAHMGIAGSIDLATTNTTEVLLIEGFPEPVLTSDPARVLAAASTFNNVRSDALPRVESRAKLQEAMERWSE